MKPRVLLADADAAMSGLCRAYLAHVGYQVDTALDGAECLSKLRSGHPDVLLLDRGLPGGGGEQVLAQIRGDGGPHLPVVMIADLMPFNALSGLRRPPVVRCLQRPIRIAALCDCIDSLVRPRQKQPQRGARRKASGPRAGQRKPVDLAHEHSV